MSNVFDYIFNIGGNYTATINGMSTATGDFSAKVDGAQNSLGKLTSALAIVDLTKNAIEGLHQATEAFSGAGIALNSQMHDLSAIAGVTGDSLEQVERFARKSAKTFGTDASVAVEGYKLLLSQLSPELGKYPEALRAMGDNIQITSKLMGGDGVAAAQVLTTAMNQYGVSLEDPIRASEEMARMMNVMAAAGQAGSAELPAISAALQQCGMAAKAANVSFEETNAAIQVLDKAGKKASEGGVALRNVLGQLSKGRFVEKHAAAELQKAGIDVRALGDNSKSLKERLELLKPMLNDSALLSKFFGVENANAARALIQGTEALDGFTQAVTGTNSATDQAAIIMQSYAERQAVFNQKIEDLKISLFQATGDLALWAGAAFNAAMPMAQLSPLIMLICKSMVLVKNLNWAGMWSAIRIRTLSAVAGLMMYNESLAAGVVISGSFKANILQATLAVLRFATVGIFNALKGLGALVLSFMTSGTASVTFSTIASTSFGVFSTAATTACRAVSVAISSIPIVGWIAAAIAALIAIGVYFWNTSAKFRAVLKGTWAAFKACFSGIGELAKQTFGAIGELIKAAFSLDAGGISKALDKLKTGFSDYGKQIGSAFNEAYDAEMAESAKKQTSGKKQTSNGTTAPVPTVEVPTTDPTGGGLANAGLSSGSGGDSGAGKIRNITINIEKLVERIELHTATLTEGTEQVKERVLEALMGALNDTQLATE